MSAIQLWLIIVGGFVLVMGFITSLWACWKVFLYAVKWFYKKIRYSPRLIGVAISMGALIVLGVFVALIEDNMNIASPLFAGLGFWMLMGGSFGILVCAIWGGIIGYLKSHQQCSEKVTNEVNTLAWKLKMFLKFSKL